MNRREFLKAGAAGLAAGILTPHVAGAADDKPLRAGLIGTGWYGKNDMFRLIQVAKPNIEVVSLCDVDRRQLERASELITARLPSGAKTPRLYGDYREMLKERDLDVCLIGTPDHWHALTMIAATEAGADVYVQKPVSVDVREGEAMVAAARKHNRVVQVGMQRRSTPHLIEAREKVLKAGLLGTIGHVDVCCYFHMRANDNPAEQPVPDHLNYEMWTGPAPMRPYDGIPHVRWWRTFMQYGNGIMGDMCVHMLDTARWLLDLGWPSRISSHGGILVQRNGKSNITDTQTATFEFDAPHRLTMQWVHRTWGSSPDPDYPWSVIIYGDKGTLKASTERWEFFPRGKREAAMSGRPLLAEKDFEPHAASATREHMRNFLAARRQRSKPVADIEQGHISAASCILANVGMEVGRTIEVNPATGKVSGGDDLQRLLARPYRGEWQHPGGAGEWKPWEFKA
jgi:predicted dehydrogenase